MSARVIKLITDTFVHGYALHIVWMIDVSARSHMGFGHSTFITPGKWVTQTKNFIASAPAGNEI